MYFKGIKCFLTIFVCCSAFSLFAKNEATDPAVKNIKKPVCFIENKGQVVDEQNHVRTDIKYKLSTPGLNLYLGSNSLHYQFKNNEGTPKSGLKISSYQMDVNLIGANKNPVVVNEGKQDYFENYYLTANGTNGFTANSFSKVTYKDVYPGIDWVLYINDGKVEYDFVVRPEGKVKDIKLQYLGAKSLSVTKDGRISAETPMGKVEEKKPYAFETATGLAVASKFHLKGDIITFETGNYQGTLTIDPYLSWSTYLGGNTEDVATSVASYGGTGLLYVGGYTSSNTGLSVGVGIPYNTYGGGSYDAFVAAYNVAGGLAWATYFGGTATDQGTGIAVDGTGNIYLTGNTGSTGLGTAGTYQATYTLGNGVDAFLVKFNNAGAVQWATYFGGTGDDYANALACDAFGNIYIVGQTTSAANIASAGAFQTALSGINDGFFAKFTGAGALAFSSYFGGSAQDNIFSVACDASGNFIFTGQTNSNINIATPGAHQIGLNGLNDAFVEQFSSLGTRNWGTYFGGTGTETGVSVACDGLNNIAIIGNTTSNANIATTQAQQTTFGGIQDAFIALFNTTGSLKWSTYYGGNNTDYGTSIHADNMNNFAVCGYTLSGGGFATTGAVQASNVGGFDAFTAKFDPLGRRFWGTFFGGIYNDFAYGITTDANGLLTMVGSTGSYSGLYNAGGIASSNTVHQPVFGGGTTDGFVAQLTADTVVLIAQPYTDTLVCAGGTLVVNYNTNSIGTTTLNVQLSDAFGVFPALTTSGIIGTTVSTTLTGTITCTIPAGISGNGYRIRIISSAPSYISPDDFYNIKIVATLPAPTMTSSKSQICVGQSDSLFVTATYRITSYNWVGPNGFTATTFNTAIIGAVVADGGMYYVTIAHNGCPNLTDSLLITVNSTIPPTPIATVGAQVCKNYPISLYANPGAGAGPFTYGWTGPGLYVSTLQNPTRVDVAGNAAGVYTVTDTLGGCPSAAATLTVTLTNDLPASIHINVNVTDTTICHGDSVTFTTSNVNGGISPLYQWMTGLPYIPVIGGTANIYSSAHFTDGEKVFCIMTSSAACAYPLRDTSNIITIHVADSTPIAYITASPDSNILPGDSVTFYAYAVYPGTITVFQWYVNDTLVPAAIASYFTIPHITSQIHVKVQVFSPAKCANPDKTFSNIIGVHFINGVANVTPVFNDIELFPNPNMGAFTLKGELPAYNGATVSYEVTNTIGQVILTGLADVINNKLSKTVDLKNIPDGIYMLSIHGEGQSKIMRFTVQH